MVDLVVLEADCRLGKIGTEEDVGLGEELEEAGGVFEKLW